MISCQKRQSKMSPLIVFLLAALAVVEATSKGQEVVPRMVFSLVDGTDQEIAQCATKNGKLPARDVEIVVGLHNKKLTCQVKPAGRLQRTAHATHHVRKITLLPDKSVSSSATYIETDKSEIAVIERKYNVAFVVFWNSARALHLELNDDYKGPFLFTLLDTQENELFSCQTERNPSADAVVSLEISESRKKQCTIKTVKFGGAKRPRLIKSVALEPPKGWHMAVADEHDEQSRVVLIPMESNSVSEFLMIRGIRVDRGGGRETFAPKLNKRPKHWTFLVYEKDADLPVVVCHLPGKTIPKIVSLAKQQLTDGKILVGALHRSRVKRPQDIESVYLEGATDAVTNIRVVAPTKMFTYADFNEPMKLQTGHGRQEEREHTVKGRTFVQQGKELYRSTATADESVMD